MHYYIYKAYRPVVVFTTDLQKNNSQLGRCSEMEITNFQMQSK